MPSLTLYTGAAKTGKLGFTTATLDLVTGAWRHAVKTGGTTYEDKNTDEYDYTLRYFREYTNPSNFYEGCVIGFDISFAGRNYIDETGADQAWILDNLYRPEGGVMEPVTKPTEITTPGEPTDWAYAWMDYCQNQTWNWAYNSYVNPPFNDRLNWNQYRFKFPTNVQFQHFYTAGENFFYSSHYWGVFQDRPLEVFNLFGSGNVTSNRNGVGGDARDGWWRFGGITGQRLNVSIGVDAVPERWEGWNGQTNEGVTNKPTMKQFFVSFTTDGMSGMFPIQQYRGATANDPVRLENFIGIMTVRYSVDGIIQSAHVDAITLDFWQPEDKIGNWGPDAGIEGGDGTFVDESDIKGDKDGQGIIDDASERNRGANGFLGSAGSNGYTLWSGVSIPTLCNELFFPSGTDGGLSPIIKTYEQSFFNPVSAIIGAHMITSSFSLSDGVKANVTAAGYEFKHQALAHETQSIATFHMPKPFSFPKFFDAYPDFSPYSTCKLYLPYIGFIDIDINLVQHGWLSVDYMCDMMNGNVVAYVFCSDKDGNTYDAYVASGNCAFNIPIYSNAQDGSGLGKIVTGAVTTGALMSPIIGAVGGAGAVAAGGMAGGIAQTSAIGIAVGGGGMAAGNAALALQQKPTVIGQFGSGASRITELDCFLMIQRPVWIENQKYNSVIGVPSELSGTINQQDEEVSGFSGFLKVKNIDLSGVTCTDEEKAYIEQVMKSGIFV